MVHRRGDVHRDAAPVGGAQAAAEEVGGQPGAAQAVGAVGKI